MFRHLIMVIFMLYMKYLLSSFAQRSWAVCKGKGGDKVARDLVSVRNVGRCGLHEGSMLLPKFIIVKYMLGIILCLCVLCNYTKL